MWILNYLDLFMVLFLFITIFLEVCALSADANFERKKSNIYSICSFVSVIFLIVTIITLGISDSAKEYVTPPSHKIYIRQVGNNNMFVGTRYSGNDVAKYQVLTEDGEYKEFNASSTRIIFSKVKKPYIQVYKVQYTKFLGKLAQAQFDGKGYNHKYAYNIVVPESSVERYVRINY